MNLKGRLEVIDDLFHTLEFVESGRSTGFLHLSSNPDGEGDNLELVISEGKITGMESTIRYADRLVENYGMSHMADILNTLFHYIVLKWPVIFSEFRHAEPKEMPMNQVLQDDGIVPTWLFLNFISEKEELNKILSGLIASDLAFEVAEDAMNGDFSASSMDMLVYGKVLRGERGFEDLIFRNLPMKKVLKSILRLRKAGILRPVRMQVADEKHTFVITDDLKKYYTLIVGPMSEILLSEVQKETGYYDSVPVSAQKDFFMAMIRRIPENEKLDHEELIKKFGELVK